MRYYSVLILLLIACWGCKSVPVLVKSDAQFYEFSDEMTAETSIEQLISPYKAELDGKMNEVIGHSESNLVKSQPEGGLGNFTCDAILHSARKKMEDPIDFAVSNYGGLRIPNLSKGPITRREIFELMPFDNGLVVLKLSGETVLELFNHMAALGGWPVSSQVKVKAANGKVTEAWINNERVEKQSFYTMLISDYVANGGDKCSFLIDQPRKQMDMLFRDAIMQYVEDMQAAEQKINSSIEGRFVYE